MPLLCPVGYKRSNRNPPEVFTLTTSRKVLTGALCLAAFVPMAPAQDRNDSPNREALENVRRVLLISVDGMHAIDLKEFVENHPDSNLARLSRQGITFGNTLTSKPSDSFPGLLSIVTGGSPQTTGVWYDNSYDRTLSPPGSQCKTVGTNVLYDESIEFDSTRTDGGGGINPANLPLNPSKGCTPVFPHQFLRVNTIFEVIRADGGRTAWADKHFAYDIVNGPSGHGVDDLFTPEITANGDATHHEAQTQGNDALKVQAILNEIRGLDHTGARRVGVPEIFGMNFQAVSVGQKLKSDTLNGATVPGGYADSTGEPGPLLANALQFVDSSIGRFVEALEDQGLRRSTLIIITAKHGQSPIDRTLRRAVDDSALANNPGDTPPGIINSIEPNLLAQLTDDDVALFWLSDQSKTADVVTVLQQNQAQFGFAEIFSDDAIELMFDNPRTDPRTPDIIATTQIGVIFTGGSKIAEHGGFAHDDTNVALLLSLPGLQAETLQTRVSTVQIAPTILRVLGINPGLLLAVESEHTQVLPGVF